MQTNYQGASLLRNVVITAAAAAAEPQNRERKRTDRSSPSVALASECQKLAESRRLEEAVWLGLSLSAFAVLVLSFAW